MSEDLITDGIRTRIADHAQLVAAERLAACQQVVAGQHGVDHLAHYRAGVVDFSVDLLDRVADHRVPALVTPSLAEIERAGRRLAYRLSLLDDRLLTLETGGLIRIVVHGRDGALICDAIVPDQCLVATVLTRAQTQTQTEPQAQAGSEVPLCWQPQVRAADLALAELTAKLRERIGLGSADHGGYRVSRQMPLDEPDLVVLAQVAGQDSETALQTIMDETPDLHFLGLYCGGDVVREFDGLGRPSAAAVLGTSPDPDTLRRAGYESLGRHFPGLLRELDRLARPVIGSVPERIVLDVENGALYFYPLPQQYCLLGVTLQQHHVSTVEDRVAQIAQHLVQELTGG
jgi:hypothetical protein